MRSLEYSSVGQVDIEVSQSRGRRLRQPSVWLKAGAFLAVVVVIGTTFLWDGSSEDAPESETQPRDPKPQTPSTPKQPEILPTPKPTTSGESCEAYFECKTDRLGHESPLYAGQAICNGNFMMGLSSEGVFQWRDCTTTQSNVFYNQTGNYYFAMLPDASWNIYDKDTGELKWKEECLKDVHVHPECLRRPRLDCPYIHLHKNGDIVVNWIDDNGTWMDRNARNTRLYSNLFE